MKTVALLLCLFSSTAALAGKPTLKGDSAQALFERLKALEGEWVAMGEDGKPTDEVVLIYHVVAGGHAVMSTEFPGSDHEMITVYHPEGNGLEMTHYCALGNRPNMVARSFKGEDAVFECKKGSDLDQAKAKHMHHGTLQLSGPDEMRSAWVLHDGGEAVYTAEFHVVRRRDF